MQLVSKKLAEAYPLRLCIPAIAIAARSCKWQGRVQESGEAVKAGRCTQGRENGRMQSQQVDNVHRSCLLLQGPCISLILSDALTLSDALVMSIR